MADWSFTPFVIQYGRKKGSGIAIMAIETDNSLRCLFALAKVDNIWVYDILWLNPIRRLAHGKQIVSNR